MSRSAHDARPRMGYQPALDGLRAISVIAVIFYHAGFGWMHGGFFGVEVFFVVSGFLITTLLIEERERTGRVSLGQFWVRRIRRLFPALFAMLAAAASWVALFGSAEQTAQMRRDLPWSVFYAANWGQVVGDVPYFQTGDPPLLRHLWSLGVEEQWYLFWPIVFIGLMATGRRPGTIAKWLLAVVGIVAVVTWWVQRGAPAPLDGVGGLFVGDDRVNFNYLSTITRAGGLLLGAAAAFVWRPWRSAAAFRVADRPLDLALGVALGLLVCCFIAADITAGYMYPWLLLAVSVLSLVAVLIVVHPAATGSRYLLSRPAVVAIGMRSYGWYLWHWPVFVVIGATDGSWPRFVAGAAVSLVIAEASYRFVELPVRNGAISRWWADRSTNRWAPVGGAAVLSVSLMAFYATVEPFDAAVGGDEVTFVAPVDVPTSEVPAVAEAPPVVPAPSLEPVTTTTEPSGRPISIVGDSQAHSLAVNLPSGIESTFRVTDHSLDGCSVYESGRVLSARSSFKNSFEYLCADWIETWRTAASDAEVVLVVLGAWDVFDLEIDGQVIPFGTSQFDAMFTQRLRTGTDAMVAEGAHVALLEVACMRPQDVEGAAVRALPERGDDARVAHLNELLRAAAAAQPAEITFVEGPTEWCGDEAMAGDLGLRWDGVHVWAPGAKLIFETIAPALLTIGT